MKLSYTNFNVSHNQYVVTMLNSTTMYQGKLSLEWNDYANWFQSYLEESVGLVIPNIEKWGKFIQSYSIPQLKEIGESIQKISVNQRYSSESELYYNFWQKVYQFLNISETYFYRDPEQLDAIIFEVLTPIIESDPYLNLKIWSAGCSKGEEAYTLAILLQNLKETNLPKFNYEILGTDIQEASIQWAKQGKYDSNSFRFVPPKFFQRYIESDEKSFQIKPEIQGKIQFKVGNLLDPQLDRFHLILCRNVMIYFSENQKSKIVNNFSNSLLPNGILVTGHSEIGIRVSNPLIAYHIHNKTSYYSFQRQGFRKKFDQIESNSTTLNDSQSYSEKFSFEPDPNSNNYNSIENNSIDSITKVHNSSEILHSNDQSSVTVTIQSYKYRLYSNPQDIEAYYELSSLYWDMGEKEMAKTYQSRARNLIKKNPHIVDRCIDTKIWKQEWEAYLNEDL